MKQCILQGTKDRRPTNGDAFADLEKGYGTFDQDQQSFQDRPNEPEEDFGSNWMSHLHDHTLLSALTIPGTHDSATSASHIPFVRTQSLSISDQLALGIRYFDLRCALRQNIPVMVHGLAYLNLTLASVLVSMTTFLASYPGEALVVQIKQDKKASKSDISFSRAIYLELEAIRPFLRTLPTTPSLGQVRGKIQLFRRYNLPRGVRGYGIDVTQWQDNPEEPFTIHHPWFRQQLTIQDHYSFTSGTSLPSLITLKSASVISLLNRAASDSDPPSYDDDEPDAAHWYINFTSAFEINVWYQIAPRTIAVGGYYFLRWVDGVNARLRAWVEAKGGGKGLGIVVMDFPESEADLVEELILTNFERDEGGDGRGRGRRRWKKICGVSLLAVAVALLLMALVLAWAMFVDEQTARAVVGYLGW